MVGAKKLYKSNCVIGNWSHPRNPVISTCKNFLTFVSSVCAPFSPVRTNMVTILSVLCTAALKDGDKWKVGMWSLFCHPQLLHCVSGLQIYISPQNAVFPHTCYINDSFHQRKWAFFNKNWVDIFQLSFQVSSFSKYAWRIQYLSELPLWNLCSFTVGVNNF